MAAAVGYLEDEWEAVCGIFSRGDTDLDNNLVERMQRYFAMSRHSSLFFGSHRGAERAAVIYTVALSAKMNGLDLYETCFLTGGNREKAYRPTSIGFLLEPAMRNRGDAYSTPLLLGNK